MNCKVDVENIIIKNARDSFISPIHLNLSFNVRQSLKEQLTFMVVYVGCADDSSYDQVLEELILPPL